ncbi:MAG: aminotransferase class I/II-fold pyridoxal phosphate-dependent enzyme [Anaerolineaceae bacterium]|nr:aminotransferase class I/II-fold pyridoxal phosphate-dependent enzyme [Anaerolineaceae bacterium]
MYKEFVPFELERFMSIWEYQVDYNLSESGVHPMTTRELVQDEDFLARLLETELNYPQTNGLHQLRDQIAQYYPGSNRDNVVVTTGAAQANFTSILSLMDAGDEIAIMLPNYMQIWGIAKNLGLKINTFSLREDSGWHLDEEALQKAITPNTKLVAVCNPNNPTGHIFTNNERQLIVNATQKAGAWLLADEVYSGAEHWTDEVTPSLWLDYDKVLAIGSLSKAYGLPGLRIGWVVTQKDTADEIWARQDYVTICTTQLSNQLAAYALSPDVRHRILQRTRTLTRQGYQNFKQQMDAYPELFSFTPPDAAAIGFVRYNKEIPSRTLVDNLIQKHKTYVVPGAHFGLENHLRISYGLEEAYVNEGIKRVIEELLQNK